MKIKAVSISNILSFAPQEGSPLVSTIDFNLGNSQGSHHVLIGPNGAGKSNFIEVINQCFRKALFIPVNYNEGHYLRLSSASTPHDKKQVLTVQMDQIAWGLQAHYGNEHADQIVILHLNLNENDFLNIELLGNNRSILNDILATYSNREDITIPDWDSSNNSLRENVQLTVEIKHVAGARDATVELVDIKGPYETLIKFYLLYFRGYQEAIKLHNRHLRSGDSPEIRPLKETFALLGAYRNYGGINQSINIDSSRSFENAHSRLRNESTKSGGNEEPAVFEFVKRKVGYSFYDHYETGGSDHAYKNIYKEEPLFSINKVLLEHLGLTVKVNKPNNIDPGMEMIFLKNGHEITTSDLSSGEKGIMHFIFTLFGFDLENGLIIIDEPELHLHPQMQNEYRNIIEDVRERLDIQFILATHSPLFVHQQNIEQVYRCVKVDTATKFIQPAASSDQKGLVKILDTVNSSRIFFVNTAILVEGQTDEYFFRYLLNKLKENAHSTEALPWQKNIGDFEIFNIKGKGGRETWTSFLNSYSLETYFIGDWDNIKEVAKIDISGFEASYNSARLSASNSVQGKGSSDGSLLFEEIDEVIQNPNEENLSKLRNTTNYILARSTDYKGLINHIKNTDNTLWKAIEQSIDSSYSKNIYILKNGEFEDYLSIRSKKLDAVVDFCENQLDNWLISDLNKPYRVEILDIFSKIFS